MLGVLHRLMGAWDHMGVSDAARVELVPVVGIDRQLCSDEIGSKYVSDGSAVTRRAEEEQSFRPDRDEV